jgi:transcriptional regulator with XRE-family HTH domain
MDEIERALKYIGAELRKARKVKDGDTGMLKVGEQSGVAQNLISTAERGLGNLTLKSLLKLSGGIDLRLSDLFLRVEEQMRLPETEDTEAKKVFDELQERILSMSHHERQATLKMLDAVILYNKRPNKKEKVKEEANDS